jgi:putative endonuclease
MTRDTASIGRRGERAAARHLRRRGWRLLARNWRAGGGEIDLVVRRGSVMAICEVKTRRRDVGPELVTARQRERIRRASACYAAWTRLPAGVDVRLDLILVSRRRRLPGWRVEHLPGALA